MKPRIAIFSASSQVASSVALYLHYFEKAHVIAYTRASFPAIFFEMIGVEHRLMPENADDLKAQLENIDAVFDFSIPLGEFWENRNGLRHHLVNLIRQIPHGIPFVSMSTQNAYGFNDSDIFIRTRLTDWASPYCSLKRYGEKLVRQLGARTAVPTYNLRLGQVHGFLQSVSGRFSEQVETSSEFRIFGNSSDLVNTLFISDLGDAMLSIVAGGIAPGTYSVLSQPQWSQQSLYQYYKDWTKNDCSVKFTGHGSQPTWNRQLISGILKWVGNHRGFVDVALLQHIPWLAAKAKGTHRVRSFGNDTLINKNAPERNLLGTPSLPILGGTDASPEHILDNERSMCTFWYSAIDEKLSK